MLPVSLWSCAQSWPGCSMPSSHDFLIKVNSLKLFVPCHANTGPEALKGKWQLVSYPYQGIVPMPKNTHIFLELMFECIPLHLNGKIRVIVIYVFQVLGWHGSVTVYSIPVCPCVLCLDFTPCSLHCMFPELIRAFLEVFFFLPQFNSLSFWPWMSDGDLQ